MVEMVSYQIFLESQLTMQAVVVEVPGFHRPLLGQEAQVVEG
jgi:hypothetical protein